MPYDLDTASDDGREDYSSQPGSSRPVDPARGTVSVDLEAKPSEPKGMARYSQPQPKTTHAQFQHVLAQTGSPAAPLSVSPASRTLVAASGPITPAGQTPARTPSRIAVIIDSPSSRRSGSQPISRKPSEESFHELVTSDINQPVRIRATTSAAATSPRGPLSTTTSPGAKAASTHPRMATSSAAPATQTPANQTARRRGRPLGWRQGMGPYSARASFPGGPSAPQSTAKQRIGAPRKRGRPAGRPGMRPTRAIFEQLRPRYVAFLCEWEGCPAELQNADTLRRHVLVVHGREPVVAEEGRRTVTCRWGKCNRQPSPARRFAAGAEFERHVDAAHLVPFVWHVGDGPRNRVMSYEARLARTAGGEPGADELPDYLFDAEGNQVTPSVLHQQIENDEERKERRRKLHRILLQRDRNAPEEEAMSEGDEEEREKILGR